MTRVSHRGVVAVWALPFAVGLVAWSGCSGRSDNSVAQGGDASGGGGAQAGASAGASAQAGTALAGSASMAGASMAGASTGGSGTGGTNIGGTSAGGMSAGGMSAGGTGSGGSAIGEGGSTGDGGAPIGGAGGANCDASCTVICEGGAGCKCSCPGDTLKCASTAQPREMSFQRACQVDDDCFGAEHYIGCCRVTVVGLNVAERESFTQWEKDTCNSPPICDCAIDTLTTDDGKMIKREMSYAARCVAAKCATWVP